MLAAVAWPGGPLIPGEPGAVDGPGDLAGWPELRGQTAADLLRLDAADLLRLDAAGIEYRPLDGPRRWQRADRAPARTSDGQH